MIAMSPRNANAPSPLHPRTLVDASETGPKLMDTILSVVGFRPAQPMPKVLKACQASEKIGLSFGWQTVEPL
jgi:hypothetical protein